MTRKRAPRGAGTVYQRTDRPGVWVAERRAGGKRQRRNFDRPATAHAWLAAGQAPRGGKLTLTGWLAEWMVKPGRDIEPRTVSHYRWAAGRWTGSRLAKTELGRITPEAIEEQLDVWRDEKLSRITLGHLRTVLGTAMNRAVKLKKLAVNPVPAVDLPGKAGATRARQITLGRDVGRALSDAWATHRYRAAFELLALTGMRPAELCALTWADLRIGVGEVSIKRAVKSQRENGHRTWYVGATKTAASTRSVSFDPTLRPILFAWRDKQGGKPDPSTWVFPSPQDPSQPLDPESLSKMFRELVDAAGISVQPRTDRSELRLYDLRALHATLLLSRGIDPVSVAGRLGHTDIVSTMRRYAGYISEADRKAAGQGALWEARPLPRAKIDGDKGKRDGG